MANETNLAEVIERHRTQVMQVEGVVGIAAGLSKTDARKRCILVYVTTRDWPEGVPRQLDGCEIELVNTAGFRAL